jgi:hypothetical protein
MHQYQGPCQCVQALSVGQMLTLQLGSSSTQYLESIAEREVHWIKTFADFTKAVSEPFQYTNAEQNNPQAHVALLRKLLSAIPHIVPRDPDLVSPRFWHPDFHAGNIYVDDEGHISSIIDWQGAWMTPAFIGANPPKLLDYGVDMMMKLPANFKHLDNNRKEELRYQVAQSILIHCYETATAQKNPLMYKMMRHPHGETLKQLEAFVGGTWDNCLYPFQHCLISVERYASTSGSRQSELMCLKGNGSTFTPTYLVRTTFPRRKFWRTTTKPTHSMGVKISGKSCAEF